jgi:phosphoglycerate dehydrogenase-like enzyme
MKVHLVGDAARQAERLRSLLGDGVEIASLPVEAGHSPRFDNSIAPEDIVVALRFQRSQPAPPFALLHVPGAGLDGITFDTLSAKTAVCNVFEHEAPIGEYVLWAMLNWEIRPDAMRFTAETWSERFRARPPHGEILGKRIGIVGFGRIGRAIAVRAKACGLGIVALDRSLGDARALVDTVVPRSDLKALLSASDYVVLAAPLSDETRGMMNANALAAMKKTAVLINVARAELADEQALYEALRDQTIAGAYLDVWYAYPKSGEDRVAPSRFPFLDLPNVIATPHSSAWTAALPARRYRIIADNIKRHLAGQPLVNQVRESKA